MRARPYSLFVALVCACAWVADGRGDPAAAATPAADCQPYGAHPCLLPFPGQPSDPRRPRERDRPAAEPAVRGDAAEHRRGADQPPRVRPPRRLQPRQRADRPHRRPRHRGRVPPHESGRSARRVAQLCPERPGGRDRRGDRAPAAHLDRARRQRPERRDDQSAHPSGGQLPRGPHVRGGAALAAHRPRPRHRGPGLVRRAARSPRPQPPATTHIFAALDRAGIARGGLTEAWDFTVGSARSLAGRLLSIRNQAFASLGDRNLQRSPRQRPRAGLLGRERRSAHADAPPRPGQLPDPVLPRHLRAVGRNRLPLRLGQDRRAARASCRATPPRHRSNASCPTTATPSHPARISLYGHGLLGSHSEVEAGNVQAMATEHNTVFCATDWWGLAKGDTGLRRERASPTSTASRRSSIASSRVCVNTLFLGRLLLHPQGLAANPAFRTSGRPVIEPRAPLLRRQQPGRDRGRADHRGGAGLHPRGARGERHELRQRPRPALHATSPRSRRSSLAHYPDRSLYPVILDVIQQLWDRGDPDGYAQHMTAQPVP